MIRRGRPDGAVSQGWNDIAAAGMGFGDFIAAAQSFVEEVTRAGIRAAQAAFAQPGRMDNWLAPGFDAGRLDADPPRIRCRCWCCMGRRMKDEYTPPASLRRITAGVAGPVVVDVLPGCRHLPWSGHPEQVLAAENTFLRQRLND